LTCTQVSAQSTSKSDLSIEVKENTFTNYQDGFCWVPFTLSGSADIAALKQMVAENQQYFQITTNGMNVKLAFSNKLPWAIWRKVFLQGNIAVIEVSQNGVRTILDVDGFMNKFGFEKVGEPSKK